MDHPNIARVLDGGMTPNAQPYFVMELVDGRPLNKFCDEMKLTLKDRLELFVPICQAVQHAHQKGIVHRDLKPANILVTLIDGKAAPKVIDFGVAKATAGKLTDQSLYTQIGSVVGTLEYMAPEQAGDSGTDIDTRADIYSLGVVLYELLTGLRPIDTDRLKNAAILEMIRIVRRGRAGETIDPTVQGRFVAKPLARKAGRQAEPRKLMAQLRGELDWVVMKCLEKQRERRYESASGLARDIQRYLADETVEARPPSKAYRLKKFIRRNRLMITAACVVAAALMAATGASVWFGMSEARQRAEADRLRDLAETNAAAEVKARARAEAITSFVTNALESSDPMQFGKQDMTISQAMAKAVAEIESGAFKNGPETEAGLMDTIGNVLRNNGKYTLAQPLLERSLKKREALFKDDHADIAVSMNNLASLYIAQGEFDKAGPLLTRALAIFEKARGPEHRDTAAALNALAALDIRRKRPDRAEPLLKRALAIREKILGPNDRDLALTLNDLAILYSDQRKYDEAEPLLKRSLAIYEKSLGPEHPDVAACLNSLALLYEQEGKYDAAEPCYVRALAICEKAPGPEHPLVGTALQNLADMYRSLGRYALAEPMYIRALANREKALGPEHRDVSIVLNNLALLYKNRGRYAEAEPLYLRSLAIDEKTFGANDPEVAFGLYNLGGLYEAETQYAKAEAAYKRSLAIREKALGADHPDVAASLSGLAMLYRAMGQYTQAEPLSLRAVEISRKAFGPEHPNFAQAIGVLASIQSGLGKTAEARQGFDQALTISRKRSPGGSQQLARMLWRSATARIDSKAPAELQAALRELEEAVAMNRNALPADHPSQKEYGDTLAKCKAALAEQGKSKSK